MMLEEEFLKAKSCFILFNVSLKLSDGITRKVKLEHETTNFIADETSDSFDFEAICVNHSDVFEVRIGLCVVSKIVEIKLIKALKLILVLTLMPSKNQVSTPI